MQENMTYKTIDGNVITCAMVIINSNGDILGVHATGKAPNYGYDFPKGLAEDNEDDKSAALRELMEETGIVISNQDDPNIIDCGIYPHNKNKLIHIFLYRTDEFPDVDMLKCDSYFEADGKMLPEVDGFEIIPKEDRDKFNKVLQNKFQIIDRMNHE